MMTLLQHEKSSQKMTLEKQIEDGQKALEKKERELLLLQEEMQKVRKWLWMWRFSQLGMKITK